MDALDVWQGAGSPILEEVVAPKHPQEIKLVYQEKLINLSSSDDCYFTVATRALNSQIRPNKG